MSTNYHVNAKLIKHLGQICSVIEYICIICVIRNRIRRFMQKHNLPLLIAFRSFTAQPLYLFIVNVVILKICAGTIILCINNHIMRRTVVKRIYRAIRLRACVRDIRQIKMGSIIAIILAFMVTYQRNQRNIRQNILRFIEEPSPLLLYITVIYQITGIQNEFTCREFSQSLLKGMIPNIKITFSCSLRIRCI
ncbi:hypothetical protein D3C78_1159380 [compost metagenome]